MPASSSVKRPTKITRSPPVRPPQTRNGAAIDFSRNLVPIYLQLVTIFRRFIVTGEWELERQIPTLEDLAAQFGVARATVRHAIDFLEREGLLARYRRHGTFVVGIPQIRPRVDIPTTWRGLAEAKTGFEAECLSLGPAAAAPALPSHGAGGGTGRGDGAAKADTFARDAAPAPAYDTLRRIWRRDGHPISIETVQLDRRLRKRFGAKSVRDEPVGALLDGDAGISIGRVDQTILIGTADAEIAGALEVPADAPVAVMHVSVYDGDAVLICDCEEFFRGDQVGVVERLKF